MLGPNNNQKKQDAMNVDWRLPDAGVNLQGSRVDAFSSCKKKPPTNARPPRGCGGSRIARSLAQSNFGNLLEGPSLHAVYGLMPGSHAPRFARPPTRIAVTSCSPGIHPEA
ncbi:hypothetical protein HPB47_020802 [Ixodes persulcatus]|uniref:Uncharacterized protein n=1 Tax=Ixodes persulcatus TaxID=34615 RepID=A0AC60QEF5_IXOPE|nr:hypothetical protein HPB47_020802 [Ixodes persulcatus]